MVEWRIAHYTKTSCVANSAGKLCVADPLHTALNDGHYQLSV